MLRLIWGFAGHTYHIVENLVSAYLIPLKNSLDPEQALQNVVPGLDQACSTLW